MDLGMRSRRSQDVMQLLIASSVPIDEEYSLCLFTGDRLTVIL